MRFRSATLAAAVHLVLSLAALGQETNKPEAEVSASSYPVKITLSIYKTRIKLRKVPETKVDYEKLMKDYPHYYDGNIRTEDIHKYDYIAQVDEGEPLWFKITLTNIGTKPFGADSLFYEDRDYVMELDKNHESFHGIYFEVIGPNEEKLQWHKMITMDGCPEDQDKPYVGVPPDPMREKRKEAEFAAWKKAGFSDEKIQRLLNKQLDKENERKKEEMPIHPPLRLEPGKSVATHPGYYKGLCKGTRPNPPKPIGDFAELWNFHLDKPGVYKIRVYYKHGPPNPDLPYPNMVTFKTPYIKIEVKP